MAMRETKEEEDDDDSYNENEEDESTTLFFDAQRRYMTPIQRRLNSTLLHVVLITYSVSCSIFFFGLFMWVRAVLPPYAIAVLTNAAITIMKMVMMPLGIDTTSKNIGGLFYSGAANGTTDRQVEWLLFSS